MYGNLYVLDDETNTYKLVSSLNINTTEGILTEYLNTVLIRLENVNRGSVREDSSSSSDSSNSNSSDISNNSDGHNSVSGDSPY